MREMNDEDNRKRVRMAECGHVFEDEGCEESFQEGGFENVCGEDGEDDFGDRIPVCEGCCQKCSNEISLNDLIALMLNKDSSSAMILLMLLMGSRSEISSEQRKLAIGITESQVQDKHDTLQNFIQMDQAESARQDKLVLADVRQARFAQFFSYILNFLLLVCVIFAIAEGMPSVAVTCVGGLTAVNAMSHFVGLRQGNDDEKNG